MKISYKKLFKKRFFKKTGYISVCSKTFLKLYMKQKVQKLYLPK